MCAEASRAEVFVVPVFTLLVGLSVSIAGDATSLKSPAKIFVPGILCATDKACAYCAFRLTGS